MPQYTYKCHCGKERDLFRRVEDRNKKVICECGKEMKLKISAVPTRFGNNFHNW
jgi:putative FmdB family regulatory protein